jgi:hypothetical protein
MMAIDDEDSLAQIQRAGEISRAQNQAIMQGHIGAMAAASLNFVTSMLSAGLLHPGGDIENTETLGNP